MKTLDVVKTSVYMVPVITVASFLLVLKEPMTGVSAVGTILAAAGLFISEHNGKGSDKGGFGTWIYRMKNV